MTNADWIQLSVQLMAGIASAFVGAGAAFWLERLKRRSEATDEQFRVAVDELVNLFLVARFQETVWRGMSKDGVAPKRWLDLASIGQLRPRELRPSRLNFILDHKETDAHGLVVSVAINHEIFVDQVNVFDQQMFEMLSAMDKNPIDGVPSDDLIAISAGRTLTQRTRTTAGWILRHGIDEVEDGWKAVDSLRAALQRVFPDREIQKFARYAEGDEPKGQSKDD